MAENIEQLFEKANNFFYKNDYDNALEFYSKVISHAADHYQSYQKMARIEVLRGNVEKAIEYYRKSLEINGSDANIWNDLGNIYFDQKKYEESIECYKSTISVDVNYYWAYFNIGLALKFGWGEDTKKRDESREWQEKAIAIKEDYYPALNELGLFHMDRGQNEKAEEYFFRAIAAFDRYKYPYYNLAKIYKDRGDLEKSKLYLSKSIKCSPKYTKALNNLGILFYDEGDNTTAMYYYTRALEADENYQYALFNIGLVFDRWEEYKKAYEVQCLCLERNPGYEAAMEEKTRLEEEHAIEIKNGKSLEPKDLKSATYQGEAKVIGNEDEEIAKEKERQESGRKELYAEKFGRNITAMAREGKLYTVLGRDKEIKSVMEVLYKIKKNNPIIVGKAGVGKTAVIEGLAQKIVSGDVPEHFKDMEIVEISIGMVVAGTKYRGEFETKLKRIIDEVRDNEKLILFIDEVHMIVGAGETEGSSVDAANILKPALARGELRCIGATTIEEYTKYIQKDPALERRFYKIQVDELDRDSTLEILRNLKGKMESHFKITVEHQLLELIVELAHEEIKNRVFPDKAIDILENSFSRCALDGKSMVDEFTVKNIIGELVGIRFLEVEEDKGRSLLEMEKFLKARVYGQDEAIDRICGIIRLTKQKLDLKPYQPDGVFFFGGPTGVGKTYLAKQVSQFLFGTEDKLITINMSEFTESHSISKLIGSPPGYVGYNDIPIFTSKIAENPSSLLLLDEVEKAHPEVLKLFLQIFDEGKIDDTAGHTIYFSNVTIIMTSNAIGTGGAGLGFTTGEESPDKAAAKLAGIFPPEFVNRIDDVIIFNPIERDVAGRILEDLIMANAKKVFLKRGIDIQFNSTFSDHILSKGFSRKFGVRNLERVFEKEVLTGVSSFLFKNPEATSLCITVEDGRVTIL